MVFKFYFLFMGCHTAMDTKELFPRTFMRAPSSAPKKTPAADEQIHCGWMFTPSSMYPAGGAKSALKTSTVDFWSLTATAEKDSGGDGFVSAGWPTQEKTKHVTFEDTDNDECAPMDISGE
jgi:hypothetical protein